MLSVAMKALFYVSDVSDKATLTAALAHPEGVGRGKRSRNTMSQCGAGRLRRGRNVRRGGYDYTDL